jgi:hypothetical protein
MKWIPTFEIKLFDLWLSSLSSESLTLQRFQEELADRQTNKRVDEIMWNMVHGFHILCNCKEQSVY